MSKKGGMKKVDLSIKPEELLDTCHNWDLASTKSTTKY